MGLTNYDAMSNAELKQYFLKRGDQSALQTYLDRLNQRPHKIIAHLDALDFDKKVQAAIRQKLEAARNSKRQHS